MNKNRNKKILILALMLVGLQLASGAESLFLMGVSANNYAIEPRSLYSSVRARGVGDLITVKITEDYIAQDQLTYAADRS